MSEFTWVVLPPATFRLPPPALACNLVRFDERYLALRAQVEEVEAKLEPGRATLRSTWLDGPCHALVVVAERGDRNAEGDRRYHHVA
jgi:hypothetical protein